MNDFLAETVSAGHFSTFKLYQATPMPKHRDLKCTNETGVNGFGWQLKLFCSLARIML